MHKLDFPAFDWPIADFPQVKYPLEENVEYNRQQENKAIEMVRIRHLIAIHINEVWESRQWTLLVNGETFCTSGTAMQISLNGESRVLLQLDNEHFSFNIMLSCA